MRCPVDGETLVMTDRSGVEIDYCPKCRGVWLDRGELDKILERAGGAAVPPVPTPGLQGGPVPLTEPGRRDDRTRDDRGRRHDDDDDDDHRYGKRYKRRESFLGDLFDF
jgi:Zn-finger nucleic acid-binding protein